MNTMKKQLLLIVIACMAITSVAWAQQPGSLDASFNGKGMKSFSFAKNTQAENVTASFLQPDGKLLVAMISYSGGLFDTTSYIARFLPDGREDLSFGVSGKRDLDANFLFGNNAYFVAYSIALQSDGTIILGGTRRSFDYNYPCIVSLKPDGSFNELFGNGTSYVWFSSYQNNMILTVQVHPKTGNIWASGGGPSYGTSSFFISCLTRTGQAHLGDGGVMYNDFFPNGTGYDYATCSVIKGTTLYIGGTVQLSDSKRHFGVMAIDINTGFKKSSFFYDGEGGGTVTTPFPIGADNSNAECSALRFAPDSNSLFLAGTIVDGNNTSVSSFMLTKINLKDGGYLDEAFSEGGTKVYRMNNTSDNHARSFDIEPNGKMMLAGTLTDFDAMSYWTALKLLPNGSIDESFGTAGRKVYNGNNGNSLIKGGFTGISFVHYNKSSQKYLFVGHYINPVLFTLDALAKRINNNGEPDNSFANNSEKIFWGKDENSFLRDVAVRSDGKMVIVGSSRTQTKKYRDAIAFFNADGSQDKNFGGTGVVFLSTVLPVLENAIIVDVEVLPNNKILVAGHQRDTLNTADSSDLFVVRLNENGSVDDAFGSGGYVIKGFYSRHDILQGMVLQGNDILLYGYGTNTLASYSIGFGIMRISSAGIFDGSFGTGGFYFFPAVKNLPDEDALGKDCEVRVRGDGKIIGANYKMNTSSNNDMAVFMLSKDGIINLDFGGNGDGIFLGDYGPNGDQRATALYIYPNNKILAGGSSALASQKDYALVKLNEDGTKDADFGSSGWSVINEGFPNEGFSYLTVNDDKIIGTGYYLQNSKLFATALRFNAKGALDNSFGVKGYIVLGSSLPISSLVANNKLYIAGGDRKLDGQTVYNGLVYRMNLGSGPSIKTTNLLVSDYNKFLGDAPFLLSPNSNSPGAKTYSISYSTSGCATVNPTTGLVTMTCATVNYGSIVIQVIQPATTGFSADTAYSTLNIGKGIPEIVFNQQGDTLTSYFELVATSTSDATAQFYPVDPYEQIILIDGGGLAYVNQEGCVDVTVHYEETNNYLAADRITSVCGYTVLLPPVAFNDNLNLNYPVNSAVSINPLTNDEAYTGTLKASGIDLDPSEEGIQRRYYSPALGKFEVDTLLGVVIYTPFEGFMGNGSIDYVLYDSKGSASATAKIFVNITSLSEPVALRATELFTPNNDGLNDAFVINTVLGKENELKIFDRNGAELFTKNNYNNDWYGELPNGKKAENGIYYYTFKEQNGEKTRELQGVVELRR